MPKYSQKAGRTTSVVWDFLEKLDSIRSFCRLCRKEIKHSGNTANLLQHLKRKHPEDLMKLQHPSSRALLVEDPNGVRMVTEIISQSPGISQTKSSRVVRAPTKFVMMMPSSSKSKSAAPLSISRPLASSATVEEVDVEEAALVKEGLNSSTYKSLIRMICMDLHPPTIVEDVGFTELLTSLQSDYILPTVTELTSILLPEKYIEVRDYLKDLLASVHNVTISLEIWTVEESRHFMTITAHFIPSERLISSVLSTKEVMGLHSPNNIAECLWNELTFWGIAAKVSFVVCVDDLQLVQAVECLDLIHIPCIDKVLSQCVTDMFLSSHLIGLVERFRQIVVYFKCNEDASMKLSERQQELGEQELRIIPEENKQWMSTWKMLERLLLLKDNLLATYWGLSNAPDFPSATDWQVIGDIVATLKHIEVLTNTELATEKYPTIAKIMPLIRGLRYTMNNFPLTTDTGEESKENLVETIGVRLAFLESHETICKARILDPRFKKLLFDDAGHAEATERSLETELAALIRSECSGQDESSRLTEQIHIEVPSLWSQLDKKVWENKMKCTPEDTAKTILQQYLKKEIVPRTEDPIVFWANHRPAFPQLFRLAMKYLCIPAIATPSDILYTTAGMRRTERRPLLKESLDHILFLHSNFDIADNVTAGTTF